MVASPPISTLELPVKPTGRSWGAKDQLARMEIPEKRPSWFVRVLLVLFCLLLSAMVVYRFIWIEPRAEINAGIITLLCMLLVLVLAESFDSFSLGKLITITRKVEAKEKEVAKLGEKNEKLMSQLFAMSNSLSQTQTHLTVSGDYYASQKVEQASPEEVKEAAEIGTKDALPSDAPLSDVPQTTTARLTHARPNSEKLNRITIAKLTEKRSLEGLLIEDAKFANQFHGLDPISDKQVIFDGYIAGKEIESFIEVRLDLGLGLSPIFSDRLYLMLSKINYYKMAKRADARLELALVRLPNEERGRYSSRLLASFQPAIASGLLRITEIDLNLEEAASIREP